MKIPLRYFKASKEAIVPIYSTDQAACFDLCACFHGGDRAKIELYSPENTLSYTYAMENMYAGKSVGVKSCSIPPHHRAKIPTGLIFDIPVGYSIRTHARSGKALKEGMILANEEGVIDSDYIHETYILIYNNSDKYLTIAEGDRIAQAEIMPHYVAVFEPMSDAPGQKTNRNGGFGSTGV